MRPIDADALIPDRDYYEGCGYDAVSCEQIDNAPTVDVIPNKEGYEMYNKGYMSGYERSKEERPHGDLIRVKDLTAFIRACRDELFDKMKDYSQGEFEIRDNMLINFEQIVKLASSKYKADMRE